MSKTSVINNLKKIRKKRGYTRQELAKISGVAVASIRNFEDDSNDMCLTQFVNVINLAVALNVSVDELFKNRKFKSQIRKAYKK